MFWGYESWIFPTQNYEFWLQYFCLYFRCGYDEKLECEPQPCEPQPMMQKMLAIRRWKWKIYLLLDKPFQIQRYHDAKFLSNLLKDSSIMKNHISYSKNIILENSYYTYSVWLKTYHSYWYVQLAIFIHFFRIELYF